MFDRELLKGSTALLILQLLDERDMYGYELVKEMDRRSGHQMQVKEGTLYPALHKLEKQGYIECYWQTPEKGPARKYYQMTEPGRDILKEKTNEWHRYVDVMNNMIGRNET